jgi:hypothetical protein
MERNGKQRLAPMNFKAFTSKQRLLTDKPLPPFRRPAKIIYNGQFRRIVSQQQYTAALYTIGMLIGMTGLFLRFLQTRFRNIVKGQNIYSAIVARFLPNSLLLIPESCNYYRFSRERGDSVDTLDTVIEVSLDGIPIHLKGELTLPGPLHPLTQVELAQISEHTGLSIPLLQNSQEYVCQQLQSEFQNELLEEPVTISMTEDEPEPEAVEVIIVEQEESAESADSSQDADEPESRWQTSLAIISRYEGQSYIGREKVFQHGPFFEVQVANQFFLARRFFVDPDPLSDGEVVMGLVRIDRTLGSQSLFQYNGVLRPISNDVDFEISHYYLEHPRAFGGNVIHPFHLPAVSDSFLAVAVVSRALAEFVHLDNPKVEASS